MKNFISIIFLFALLSCSNNKEQNSKLPRLNLDGYWICTSSGFVLEKAFEIPCCPDTELVFQHDPYAMGSHILIKKDSISFFRYPFEYYGTYKYEIVGDSIFIEPGYPYTKRFSIKKSKEGNILLRFDDNHTFTCVLPAEAKYESFTPDSEIIEKLIRDSVSYDLLADTWWYLRKDICHNDGSENTIIHYPKGMPDSIFISKEIIKTDIHKPIIELKLDNRIVKMFIQNPAEYSITLTPENKKDKMLFASFVDYGEYGGVDTFYQEVIYLKYGDY